MLMDAVRHLQKTLATPKTINNHAQRVAVRNNLGHALILLGRFQDNESILREGAKLLREALGAIDQGHNPILFALTQRNLAVTLVTLSATSDSEDELNEAVERYGLALDAFDDAGEKELAASVRRNLKPFAGHPSLLEAVSDRAEADWSDQDDEVAVGDGSQPSKEQIESYFEVLLYGSVSFTTVTGREDILSDRGSGYDTQFSADPEINIAASYDTGMGFDYGADVSLDSEDLGASTSVMHFSGGFGEIRFGQDSGAEDDMYIGGGDYQAGSGGIDGDAANVVDVGPTGSDDAIKASYYTPRVRGVQVGLSFTPDTVDIADQAALGDDIDDEGRFEDHVGVGVNWVANIKDADILAAIVGSFGQAVAGDNLSSYSFGGGVSLDSVQFGAGYTVETSFNDRELLNFGVTRTFDPWLDGFGQSNLGAGVAFLFPERTANSTVFALSADMELATGLRLLGDVAYNHQNGRLGDNDPANVSGVLSLEMDY